MSTLMGMILEFFQSPMWVDTIKDFVLANCFIFTGEEEFSLEHQKCHQQFCQIIENTLNIYLLDVIGISFDDFQEACLKTAKNKMSVGARVLAILKQATDFKYFAAKMYAYNLMLDREAASSFVLEGSSSDAFFVTSGAALEEQNHVDALIQIASAEVKEVEEKLDLPVSSPILEDNVVIESVEAPKPEPVLPPKKEKPAPLAPLNLDEPKPEQKEAPKMLPPSITSLPPTITEEQRQAMRLKIMKEKEALAKTISEEEIQKRKEMFQKRREALTQKKREECKDNIELDLKKHERPAPVPQEDPNAALLRALASRVKEVIHDE